MKIYTLLLLLGFNFFSLAQTEGIKVRAYKVIVITQHERIKGFLYSADTSALYILEDIKAEATDLITIKNSDIEKIKIGRKGQVLRGAMIGTLAGSALGFIIGFSDGDDDPGWFSSSKEEKAGFGAIAFGVLGGAVGTVIGTGKKKIAIDFNTTKYLNSLNVLRRYSMVKIDLNK